MELGTKPEEIIIYFKRHKSAMKSEIRVLGIDDSPHTFKTKHVLVIGTFFRGGKILDGVLSTKIRKDGHDSTAKLIQMINISKFKPQIRAVLLDGIAMGGFNVIDIKKLNQKTGVPIIVVMRGYPNKKKMFSALRKKGWQKRIDLIKVAGKIEKINNIHIQVQGISFEQAKIIIKITTTHADIPEPLRIAHIIASGIVKGESRGSA